MCIYMKSDRHTKKLFQKFEILTFSNRWREINKDHRRFKLTRKLPTVPKANFTQFTHLVDENFGGSFRFR